MSHRDHIHDYCNKVTASSDDNHSDNEEEEEHIERHRDGFVRYQNKQIHAVQEQEQDDSVRPGAYRMSGRNTHGDSSLLGSGNDDSDIEDTESSTAERVPAGLQNNAAGSSINTTTVDPNEEEAIITYKVSVHVVDENEEQERFHRQVEERVEEEIREIHRQQPAVTGIPIEDTNDNTQIGQIADAVHEAKCGLKRQASLMFAFVALLCVAVVVAAVAGVALSRKGSGDGDGEFSESETMHPTLPVTRANTTEPPTAALSRPETMPPTLPATRATAITAFINNITLSGNVIEYPVPLQIRAATPEERAVAWLIEEDPLQMVTDSASDRARLQQRYALLTFWFSDELDSSWWFDEGWLTANHECGWHGVGCNERIVLAFDMGVYAFDGTSYHGNSLHGSIPNDIALLTALEHLDLQANHYMTGTIPTTLGDLEKLRYINFWNVGFSPCPLPPLGKLTNLEHLDLGATYSLTGNIPENINSLTKLTYLDLQNAKLSGTIPSTIGDLTSLEYLNIEDNPTITGTIPESLYRLLQLKELKFRSMGLSGTISNSLGELSLLERFWLGFNSLKGSLPSSIGSLTNVKNFYFNHNDLSGTLPSTIGQWTTVTHVHFNNNSIRGTIPESIGNWVDVERASFHNNQLTGTMPDSICSHITGDDDLSADCNSEIVCACCTKCY